MSGRNEMRTQNVRRSLPGRRSVAGERMLNIDDSLSEQSNFSGRRKSPMIDYKIEKNCEPDGKI